jgi:hypothetical protein
MSLPKGSKRSTVLASFSAARYAHRHLDAAFARPVMARFPRPQGGNEVSSDARPPD